jgi:carbon-monoxide dehydrogenase medium subunit
MLEPFTIHQPPTVAEASELLMRFGDDAAVYAGGTELLVVLKERLAHFPHLIDIKRIPGLAEIAWDETRKRLTIGGLATHRQIECSPIVRQLLPALAALAAAVANVRVRSAGTIGGNLCFAEPHSDPATLLAALDATLTLESTAGARQIAVTDFFTGVMETVRRHDEILTQIAVPLPPVGTGVAYKRFKLHERPTAAVAAVIALEHGTISGARIFAGSIGPRPQHLIATCAELIGKPASEETVQAASRLIHDEVETTTDAFESAAYKRHLAYIVGKWAIAAAIDHASDEGASHAA